jgi:hypothetical protein
MDAFSKRVPTERMDTYAVTTPYGIVTISNGGRSVSFELYGDIRQSIHNSALFAYLQQLRKQGVTRFNTDHLHVPNRDRTLSLQRGKARLDLIYEVKGQLRECELKTRREIGLEVTAQQLTELVKYCPKLYLLVPRGCLDEAATVLSMLNILEYVTVTPYDGVDGEADGD